MDVESKNTAVSNSETQIRVTHPFQIPIFVWEEPDQALNEQLSEAILDRYGRLEGKSHSNRGGWQSPYTLHRWSEPGVRRLLEKIDEMIRYAVEATVDRPTPSHFDDWLIEAWGNVNVRGARNVSHTHGTPSRPALWSGIYYVQPGQSSDDDDVGGQTVFEDRVGMPREVVRTEDPFSKEITVEPKPGLMVLFPSTLRHRVEPYHGDELRITIAFNLYHSGFAIPGYSEYAEEEQEKSIYGSRTLWHAGQILNGVKSVLSNPSRLLQRVTPDFGTERDDGMSDEYGPLLRTLQEREDRTVNKLQSLKNS